MGHDVLMLQPDDDGKVAQQYLEKIREGGVLLPVCSSDYAESDGTDYNSYFELKFAYDNEIPVWPLRMQNIYPPIPAWGSKNSKDPSGDGPAMIALAIGSRSKSLQYLDCRGKTALEIAEAISKDLEKPKP